MPRSSAALRSAICALVVLAAVQTAPAQQPSPPPAELFFKPAEFIDAKLSPSGRRVAFRSGLGGERIGLFVWDLQERRKLSQVARYTEADVRSFAWVNDERLVFDLIDLTAGGGEQLAPGLYSAQHDGSEVLQLVKRQHDAFFSAPGSGPQPLEWYHRLLHVPPGGGREVIVGEMRWLRDELSRVTPLWLDVLTGRTRPIGRDAPVGVTGWLFDPRGEPRVAMTRDGGRRQVHWRGPDDRAWRQIDDSPVLRAPFDPVFVDAQGQLYVLRAEGPAAVNTLTRFDFASGKPAGQPFVATPGFDFDGELITDAAGRLLGVRVDVDAETTMWFDPALAQLQKVADQRLPGYVNRLTCRRCGERDMVVLVRSWSARDPGHLWLYEAAGERWQLISRTRRDVDPKAMATVDFERIKARDGRELPLWLTIPPGRKAGDKGPAVVLVHGGPWVRGGRWGWRGLEQFLASRGYVVISPEFRGSTGYGDEHFSAGLRQWGRAMQDDVADAARWAIGQGWADRLCIAGASYGGYSTLMGLINDPTLYRCGVAWLAVADLQLYLGGSWWIDDDLSRTGRRHELPEMVGDPVKDEAMLKAVSPLEQAARIRSPLLLAYGGRDLRVPLAHGERLRRAMQAAGRDPEWVVYRDEAHGWLKTETEADFARRVEAFLARHLAK